mmetsp:Transcript_28960/g.55423  ORF Transcript_28960/g.55423 Transcript_28960/m.55423 type:complete len:256 (+) Transcript_28960:5262-6029(+)
MGFIQHLGAPQDEGAASFGEGFLIHQGASDIRMHDQRIGWSIGIFNTGDSPALQAVFGVFNGVLIGNFRCRQALHAHAQAGFIHHGEHGTHTFVQIPQQVAFGLVVIQHTGGVAVDAHFFFDATHSHAISRANGACVVHEEFGYDEQGNAFDAFWAARHFCQNEVYNVVGHVVIASRDKDLLTGDFVSAVVLRLCLGPHQAQISTTMRLGQVHGACPLTGDHLGQPFVFLFVAAVRENGRCRSVCQALIHGEGLV